MSSLFYQIIHILFCLSLIFLVMYGWGSVVISRFAIHTHSITTSHRTIIIYHVIGLHYSCKKKKFPKIGILLDDMKTLYSSYSMHIIIRNFDMRHKWSWCNGLPQYPILATHLDWFDTKEREKRIIMVVWTHMIFWVPMLSWSKILTCVINDHNWIVFPNILSQPHLEKGRIIMVLLPHMIFECWSGTFFVVFRFDVVTVLSPLTVMRIGFERLPAWSWCCRPPHLIRNSMGCDKKQKHQFSN